MLDLFESLWNIKIIHSILLATFKKLFENTYCEI